MKVERCLNGCLEFESRCKKCNRLLSEANVGPQWNFNIKELPVNTNILACAKIGNYWSDIFDKDDRIIEIVTGYMDDSFGELNFKVNCGCSGSEFDRETFEVLAWMPLPEKPKNEN